MRERGREVVVNIWAAAAQQVSVWDLILNLKLSHQYGLERAWRRAVGSEFGQGVARSFSLSLARYSRDAGSLQPDFQIVSGNDDDDEGNLHHLQARPPPPPFS